MAVGIDGVLVAVEVDLASQLPAIATVGLAAVEVREAKDRVRAAIRNSGFTFPPRRVTVNLAPANLPKRGTAFDLPIAVALLAAASDLPVGAAEGWVLVGELGLDGRLRPVTGVLPVALAARTAGGKGLIVPRANGAEAARVAGIEVREAELLGEVVAFLRGDRDLARPHPSASEVGGPNGDGSPTGAAGDPDEGYDLAWVRGHLAARRALEIAAAGSLSLLLSGPPGVGKTMLARCLPSILPPLTAEESLEVASIHSVAGLPVDRATIDRRPFRSPHPSMRKGALLGGGDPLRPGEVTLAHRGVLFLDELPEVDRDVLEALRGPLEEREVSISRAGRRIRFPADFALIAGMNPCRCGFAGTGRCVCPVEAVDRYLARISGPLLDRIDLHVKMEPLSGAAFDGPEPESSSEVRARVAAACAMAAERDGASRARRETGAVRGVPPVERDLTHAVRHLLAAEVDRGMSARGRSKALRIARTLADLAGESRVREEHVQEAFAFRPTRERFSS